jgi:hypothetical protein
MAYIWQRWMADEFRAAGLKVIEVDGWESRGRPASTGSYDPRHGVTNHHTGVRSSASSPGPTLKTLVAGRSDLPGPLAPWSVRYDGVVVVIAAGRCNHAGRVGKAGVPGVAIGADGNAVFMGDEVDTNGTQDMPPEQIHAIAVTNAVYLKHFDRDIDRVHRHADISGTGKWDLGSRTTPQLRADARAAGNELEDDMSQHKEQLDRIEQKIDAEAAREEQRYTADRKRAQTRQKRVVARLEKLADKVNDAATRAELQELRDELVADDAEAEEPTPGEA